MYVCMYVCMYVSVYTEMIPGSYHIQANRDGKRGSGKAIVYDNQLLVKHEMPAKFSLFEHFGIILLNIKLTIRLISLYRPPGNQ